MSAENLNSGTSTNGSTAENYVFYEVRADSYVTELYSNCEKNCFLWRPPRGYIRRADWSFELVRRQLVCRHAV
jgi:hypothetical protein